MSWIGWRTRSPLPWRTPPCRPRRCASGSRRRWICWIWSRLRDRTAQDPFRRRAPAGGHRRRAGPAPAHPGAGRADLAVGSQVGGGCAQRAGAAQRRPGPHHPAGRAPAGAGAALRGSDSLPARRRQPRAVGRAARRAQPDRAGAAAGAPGQGAELAAAAAHHQGGAALQPWVDERARGGAGAGSGRGARGEGRAAMPVPHCGEGRRRRWRRAASR